jgi:flagellar hook protein FlgE
MDMSIGGLMTTSVSGMDAQAQMLGTISKNVANSNTVGYKMASAQFSTLVDQSAVGNFQPGGVNFSARNGVSQQGILEATASPTDLAIQGNGFFVVQNAGGLTALTRAGSFVPDSSGYLVNTAGWRLMGYEDSKPGQTPAANAPVGLAPINVNTSGLQAVASTGGALTANMPSTANINPGPLPTANVALSKFDVKTSLIAFGNLGNQVTLDVFGSKTANNTWEVSVFDRAAASNGSFPYSSGPIANATLTFNPDDGTLLAGSPTSLSVAVPNGQTMTLDLSKSTQLASEFAVEVAKVNGNAPSGVDHISIGDDGQMYEIYKNGAQIPTYQVPLATVPSPDNLSELSGNAYAISPKSGDMHLGNPGSAGIGTIASKELEQSTVDVAAELTKMIQSQRDYTANSKVFQTGANIVDVVLNLVR